MDDKSEGTFGKNKTSVPLSNDMQQTAVVEVSGLHNKLSINVKNWTSDNIGQPSLVSSDNENAIIQCLGFGK